MSSCRGISPGSLGSVLSPQGAWAEATPMSSVLSHISRYNDIRTTPGCFLLTVCASPMSSFSHLVFTATSLEGLGVVMLLLCPLPQVMPLADYLPCSEFIVCGPIATWGVIQTCGANRTLVWQVRRPRHSVVKQVPLQVRRGLLPSGTRVLLSIVPGLSGLAENTFTC